jgi:NDP-sugar pyrophosphorylase family protein
METATFDRADTEIDVGLLGRASLALFGESWLHLKENANSQLASVKESIPAVLLVGGKGTRLQTVLSSKPKPLASIGNVPFLELLVMQLRSQGIRRMIMSTGHLAEQIEHTFGDGRRWDVDIQYAREPEPLGTAGAVKFAASLLKCDSDFLVVNGDSFTELDVPGFIRFHRQHRGLISMVVCRVPDAARYGTVHSDSEKRVTGFTEKTGKQQPGFINAGVYLFRRAMLDLIPQGLCSLEKDVFPQLLTQGMYNFEEKGIFIDIGTPEDYARAQMLYDKLRQIAVAEPQLEASKPRWPTALPNSDPNA